jgi:HPt (histidine-containing phosphotransfer) domain-containing protein
MPHSKTDKKLSELLSELKTDYLVKLPEKISVLKAHFHSHKWPELEEEFHKLKGTGKTYGFPDISVVCEKLELLIQRENQSQSNCSHLVPVVNDSISLLEKMYQAYCRQEVLDLQNQPLLKTLDNLKAPARIPNLKKNPLGEI